MRTRAMLLLLPLLALGCGDGRTSVHGKVTCNGEPLAHGHIFFEPTDGSRGLDGGADILDGEYHIRNIRPGARRVLIKSKPTPKCVPGSANSQEHIELVPPVDPIPPDAEGNGREVQLRRGDQELNFDLSHTPKKK
jgi:hypothetical protein